MMSLISFAQSDSTKEWQVSLGSFYQFPIKDNHYYDLHLELDYQFGKKHWLGSRTSFMFPKKYYGHGYSRHYYIDTTYYINDSVSFQWCYPIALYAETGTAFAQEFLYRIKFRIIKQYLMINLSGSFGVHFLFNKMEYGKNENVIFGSFAFGVGFESRFKNWSFTLQPVNYAYAYNSRRNSCFSVWPLFRVSYYFNQKRQTIY